MAFFDLSDPALPLPEQLVVDTSLLLALRPGDDNPFAEAARHFMRRVAERIAAYEMVAWLPLPVLQESYHILLSGHLRRLWEAMPVASRPANWLKMYKDNPTLLKTGIADMTRFRMFLAAIPLTPIRPQDFVLADGMERLDDLMRRYIAEYHLMAQDALLLAHAECLGVPAVATLDQDWLRATVFDVYTIRK
jgi:hypothetical protein